jgi:translocation and assembly module TamA
MALLVLSTSVWGDTFQVEIFGLESEKLRTNVEAHLGSRWVSSSAFKSERRRERFRADMEARAAAALRPYGHYFPQITSTLGHPDETSWVLKLYITPGEPVRVRNLRLEVTGDGARQDRILEWQANWTLQPGTRLSQVIWEEQKQALLDIAEEQGYLSAVFEQSSIELDLDANVADLALVLDTGARAVMGDVSYQQDVVRPDVLDSMPRFNPGDFYTAWLVDRLRTDLWRSGYFDEISVVEQRLPNQSPPRVDFLVTLGKRNKHTHQGTVGYGTDSQFRFQYRWQQHLLSERGDSIGVGVGWRQRNEELLLSGEYRLPRSTRARQHWLLGTALKTEVQEVQVYSEGSDEQATVVSGRIEDFSVRLGKAKLRNVSESQEQLVETLFVQFLMDQSDYNRFSVEQGLSTGLGRVFPDSDELLDSNFSLALGMEWDWPVIQGKRFNTSGHHEKAWVLSANEAWGSERDFTQVYLGSRWNFLLSDRWKLIVRGEVGYSDAKVHDLEQDIGGEPLTLSITELPTLYRFKTGGSHTVRGYDFEALSTNNIGSNHLLTASAEVEYQFRPDWSLSAFYDVGNAFNDWSKPEIKRGLGAGLRWYTIAGVIRIDVAQAQDLDGKPWQVHLSIGTPLL